MIRFLVALLVVASTAPLLAAAVSEHPVEGPTETIKVGKAYDLLAALNALTGLHDEVIGQGSTQRIAQVPYDLDSDTLFALNDDINILRKMNEDVQIVVKQLNVKAEADNGGPLTPKEPAVRDASGAIVKAEVPSEAQTALAKKMEELFSSDRQIAKLFHVSRKNIKAAISGPYHIQGQVLATLTATIVDP